MAKKLINGLIINDPIQGLLDYVKDIKPYHTKIAEILVEYFYNDNMDVVISDKAKVLAILRYHKPELELGGDDSYCGLGYGISWFGSNPEQVPVYSPDGMKTFDEYPAVDLAANSLIVPDDRRKDFIDGSGFRMISFDYDVSKALPIFKSFTNDNHIIVPGNQTSNFTIWTIGNNAVYLIKDSLDNDGLYAIDHMTYNASRDETSIYFKTSLASNNGGGLFGIIPTKGQLYGHYTVNHTVYNPGRIRGRLNPLIPLYLDFGIDKHTIIYTNEDISVNTSLPGAFPSVALSPNHTYEVFLMFDPIDVIDIMPLSNVYPIPPNAADENQYLNIGSDSFVVTGDQTMRFYQGREFYFESSIGDNTGRYMTMYSDYVEELNVTRIRPAQTIRNFNDIGRITNFVISEGYDGHYDFCPYVSAFEIRVRFIENLAIASDGLSLYDDLVVYNLDNNGTYGYELPYGTIGSTTAPNILSSIPGSPQQFDLLFYNDIFQQYRDGIWVPIVNAFWVQLDGSGNYIKLWRRTKNAVIDTGWLEDIVLTGLSYIHISNFNTSIVSPMSVTPNTVYHHKGHVNVDAGHDSLIVFGGNFIDRFDDTFSITGIDEDGTSGLWVHGPYLINHFSILGVNSGTNVFTLNGNFTWLFTAGRTLRVKLSNKNYTWFTVLSSSFNGVNTIITLVEPIGSALKYVGSVINGAIFDGSENKTIIRLSSTPNININAITYSVGGVLIEEFPSHSISTSVSITDNIKIIITEI